LPPKDVLLHRQAFLPFILNFSQMVGSNDVSFVQIPQASMMPNASEIMKEYFRTNNAKIEK
jgi:hypothetical protein